MVNRYINPVLKQRLGNLIASMGYEMIGCELIPQGRQSLFRIYIDKERGVTIDDCSNVSRQVSAMLDVEDPFPGKYTLEVSSPGINRPLFELAHYRQHMGKSVKIRLHVPVNQRKQYKGQIKGVVGEEIHLLVEGMEQEVVLAFSQIKKANLIELVNNKDSKQKTVM